MIAALQHRSLSRLAVDMSVRLAWEGSLAIVARRWGVPAVSLQSEVPRPAQRREGGSNKFVAGAIGEAPAAVARAAAIYTAHVVCRCSATELARVVGITAPGVRKAVARIEDARDADERLDRILDEIELELMP